MDSLAEFVKDYLIPGTDTFLILGLALGVVLLFGRERIAKWGRRWLTFLLLLYMVLSTPLCARGLEGALGSGFTPLQSAQEAQGAEVVLILGGGAVTHRAGGREVNQLSEAGALRALEGARLADMLDDPLLIVSGGTNPRAGMLTPESEPLRDVLLQAGLSPERILLESASENTYEQALNLKPLLRSLGADRFILVTSPTHMHRALATFEAQGMQPIPSVAQQHSEGFLEGFPALLPHNDALRASALALREVMALVYYTLVGRL